jgi:hypothetical protein
MDNPRITRVQVPMCYRCGAILFLADKSHIVPSKATGKLVHECDLCHSDPERFKIVSAS